MPNTIQYSDSAPLHYIQGLLLSYVSALSVAVGTGQCQNSSSTALLTVRDPITLNLSTVGAGGLDVGMLGIHRIYYVYLIAGATVGVSAIVSDSATGPLMPAGYTSSRRIGSFLTKNAIAQVIPFTTTGSGNLRRLDFQEDDAVLRLVAGGNATIETVFSCAAVLPAGATRLIAYLELVGQTTGFSSLAVAQPTLTGNPVYVIATKTGAAIAINNQLQLTTNAAQELAYLLTGVDMDTVAVVNAQGYEEIV